MCTVTYMPYKKGYILTSNRDEKVYRETELPAIYTEGDTKLCYPKDILSKGSWIALNNKGRAVCLLNGAFIPHQEQEYHTHSRGKILLEIAKGTEFPDTIFTSNNLRNTEPFTLLTLDTLDNNEIHFSEFIWDGDDKHFRQLDPERPSIWSSVTLYSDEIRKNKRSWFTRFLNENMAKVTPEEMFRLHSSYFKEESLDNLLDLDGEVLKTVSITQISNFEGQPTMRYSDLVKDKSKLLTL